MSLSICVYACLVFDRGKLIMCCTNNHSMKSKSAGRQMHMINDHWSYSHLHVHTVADKYAKPNESNVSESDGSTKKKTSRVCLCTSHSIAPCPLITFLVCITVKNRFSSECKSVPLFSSKHIISYNRLFLFSFFSLISFLTCCSSSSFY